MKKIRHLIYLILLIALDQLTKYLAAAHLKDGPMAVIPNIFELYYHENNGAVWGIMSGKISILIVATVIIMGGMIYFYTKIPAGKRYNVMRLILVFIAAGAIGNLIDRSIKKYVVDFLYFKLIDFPIFNLADCYVTISAILLIVLSLFYYKDEDFAFLNRKEEQKHD
ncbi:signal peptidase II [Anaerocolumna sp. AGMB13025]|uniref:signal peptidase II n=1 Tax=Anaerocolumna sp. AGMB13025 TaxID=3039116 RepID=UPI00241D12B0|nr:signal peptidase II [Anaerocolumna sp. AGMB13025]WFR54741.1 signal peptidase II [Anaerocolumna sp. AGMB13025]